MSRIVNQVCSELGKRSNIRTGFAVSFPSGAVKRD